MLEKILESASKVVNYFLINLQEWLGTVHVSQTIAVFPPLVSEPYKEKCTPHLRCSGVWSVYLLLIRILENDYARLMAMSQDNSGKPVPDASLLDFIGAKDACGGEDS